MPEPGDPNKDPFRSIWYGNSVRYAQEYGKLCEQAEIPYKLIQREDHLFNLISQPKFEVAVPSSFYERAKRAIAEKYGTDEEYPELDENEEVPLPEFDYPGEAPRGKMSRYDPQNWFPEDATVEVWSGHSLDIKEVIDMSLREHDILSRWEAGEEKSAVFVQPEDATRAKEIIHQILDTTAD
ncbi:MAG TPA: hypothetical protein VN025_09815 [Candidatus Dormibacteraeota bacterium]|nr:hypothetical protein [Candidatus Dormibacteraeota bacterium]